MEAVTNHMVVVMEGMAVAMIKDTAAVATEVMVVMEMAVREVDMVAMEQEVREVAIKDVAVVQCVLPMANDHPPAVHMVGHTVAVVILLMNINNKVDMEAMAPAVTLRQVGMEVNRVGGMEANKVAGMEANRVAVHTSRKMATIAKATTVPVAMEVMVQAMESTRNKLKNLVSLFRFYHFFVTNCVHVFS